MDELIIKPRAKSYKRKYTRGGLPYKKRRLFVPGKDRVGGYYGRYAGSKGETKFHDVAGNDAVVASGGTVVDSLNKIAQGVTESERVGRKCTIKSLSVHYQLTLPESDAVATPVDGDITRVIFYVDKQANGATIAVTDLLETADILSFYNLANSSRFVILCDKMHSLNYLTMASDGAGLVSQALVIKNYSFHKSLNTPIEFSATTGAITEIRSNNIGRLVISEKGLSGFFAEHRLRFQDN